KILRSLFFFSSRRRHTRSKRDWSSDVCSSDLDAAQPLQVEHRREQLQLVVCEVKDESRRCFVDLPRHCACRRAIDPLHPSNAVRSEERRVGKSVDLGGRRSITKKRKTG